MNIVIPPGVMAVAKAGIRAHVTDEMVTAFASLTGDRSSLHVSADFARRSAYRRPVAHGMLPIGLLPLLASFQIDGYRCVPVAITGRFAAPLYPGDVIELSAERMPGVDDATEIPFAYRIVNAASGKLLTEGTVTVRYERPRSFAPSSTSGTSGGPLVRPMELNSVRLEEIEAGREDTIDFSVSRQGVQELLALLRLGIEDRDTFDGDAIEAGFHLPNLLSILLYSTSVGVLLPGTSATFLEFSARLDDSVEEDVPYRLRATVSHRSRSTRIVKKEMQTIRADRPGEIPVRGKVAALVNAPFRRMPTMEELGESAMDLGLKDRVVLITGASRGIGETTAKLFALFGAKVVVNYHRGAADAARVVQEIVEAGGDAVAVGADVANPGDVAALVERAVDRYGAVHILVNNAARDFRPIPFLQLSWEEMQQDLDVIVKGAFFCCQQVIPRMLEQGGGKIVNISSVATDDPPPDQTKYVVAKSALVGLTRSLSIEFASRNIQVNLVVPSFVETDFVAHVQEGFRTRIAQDTPMRRHAAAVDVARAVVMLASSCSSFTTGQKFMVTGGGAPYA